MKAGIGNGCRLSMYCFRQIHSLEVLEINSGYCKDLDEVEYATLSLKDLAERVLGHHPTLTRLAEYSDGNPDETGSFTTSALVGNKDDELRNWTLSHKSVSSTLDLTQ
jgi:hypothetical protein